MLIFYLVFLDFSSINFFICSIQHKHMGISYPSGTERGFMNKIDIPGFMGLLIQSRKTDYVIIQ